MRVRGLRALRALQVVAGDVEMEEDWKELEHLAVGSTVGEFGLLKSDTHTTTIAATEKVTPSLATHAILILVEAGERAMQTLSLTKTAFHALSLKEEHSNCSMQFLASKRCLVHF